MRWMDGIREPNFIAFTDYRLSHANTILDFRMDSVAIRQRRIPTVPEGQSVEIFVTLPRTNYCIGVKTENGILGRTQLSLSCTRRFPRFTRLFRVESQADV